jgi:hypothetical protein
MRVKNVGWRFAELPDGHAFASALKSTLPRPVASS